MSDPSKQDIGWGKIFAINMQFAFGALILFLGWLCWQGVSVKWWGLWLLAVLCFAGGGCQVIIATVEAVKLFNRLRRWKRYQRLGSKPRADTMAHDEGFETHHNGGLGG
ncbi:hypothetical protein [Pseudophaeobacter sp.]|uniref:hypothetical protein n=1 Tax=Pseudophaeobacter sp. TaxID=1971739 RepID=UPI00261376E4|nr:hypothetical protein [Pseudophaeobacter sp.]